LQYFAKLASTNANIPQPSFLASQFSPFISAKEHSMKKVLGTACFFVCLMFFGLSFTPAEETKETSSPSAKKIRVLLTYGGHPFDAKAFYAMFDAMPDVVYTKAELPQQADLLKPGLEKNFDVIVMYDQVKTITPEQQKAFVELLQKGIGVVSLHHNIGAHDDWDEFRKIIGGKFLHQDITIDGKPYSKSEWKHDQEMDVTVADRQHPITAGIENFHICDEAYHHFYLAPDCKVLLTTNHPLNDPPVAWTLEYGKSRVFYMMFGHGPTAWQNPAYPKLLSNGIRWAAGTKSETNAEKAIEKSAKKPAEQTAEKTAESKSQAADAMTIEQRVDVAPVWSGHPVGFALITHEQRQFIAFYDAERQMTVGSRALNETTWQLVRLPLPADELASKAEKPPVTQLGWDSHNYVTMAIDADDQIHISGNMHVVPLVYFRTTKPLDISTFRWVPAMTGERETRATYPQFLSGPQNELLFNYRDGGSGNGDQIYNRYDLKTQTWSRLLDKPLFSGEGKRNAYIYGPTKDRHGLYHVCWIWRDTPDCSTNHDICYAQSKDFVHWTTSDGKPQTLPMTLETAEIVDPVPINHGLINSDIRIGFDSQDQVILSYYKFDEQGNTQVYNARLENQKWHIYQTSDWAYRWDFRGGGSIVDEIHISGVASNRNGVLTQSFRHIKHGSGTWQLDPATLKPTANAANISQSNPLPAELSKVESTIPNMEVQMSSDRGRADEPGVRYLLRWETLPPNRDRPYPGEPPKPNMLQIIKLRTPADR
jgi:type 1 glutamine amidotransferase